MADVIAVSSKHVSGTESSEDTDENVESSQHSNVNATYSSSNAVPDLLFGGYNGSNAHGEQFRKVKTFNLSRIPNKTSLFRELEELLSFDHPRVRSECSDMISRIIPQLKNDLDTCMSMVAPQLVRNLSHEDEEVRRSAANTLNVYAQNASDLENVLQHIIYNGLLANNNQQNNKKVIISSIPLLFTKDLANKDWHLLARGLLSLVDSDDAGSATEARIALGKLKNLVGEKRFQLYTFDMDDTEKKQLSIFLDQSDAEPEFEFSFVDPVLVNILMDKNDRALRVKAVEELKLVVRDVVITDSFLRELPEFLVFLSDLLDDSDFKVNFVTLEIYHALVDKLKWRLKKYLNRIVDDLVLHLGENKIVIRTQTSKVIRTLMGYLGPSPVSIAICDNLTDGTRRHNGKMKEEMLNSLMVALLSYPSYEFDLRHICEAVAPNVLDPRGRVRLAALECLAVLAQSMGSSKLAVMASAIDSAAEHSRFNTEAALAAVLARLARRQLPRTDDEGHLEYSLRIPMGKNISAITASSSFNYGTITAFPRGADVDWVLAGSGTRTPTPKSYKITEDTMTGKRDSSVLNKDQSASFPSSPAAPRRIISPGQGKNSAGSQRTDYDPDGKVRSVSITNLRSAEFSPPGQETHHHTSLQSFSPKGIWLPATNSKFIHSPINNDLEDVRLGVGNERASEVQRSPDVTNPGPMLTGLSRLLSSDGSVRGRLLTSKSTLTTMDRGSSKPMDKVAAMLGSNILPNKIRPVVDERGSIVDVKPISLPAISSNTWHGNDPSNKLPSLPSAHFRNNNNSSNGTNRQPPVPVKPTMVRSSSGGRKARINSNKSQQPIGIEQQLDANATRSTNTHPGLKSSAKNRDSVLNDGFDDFQAESNHDFSTERPNKMQNVNTYQNTVLNGSGKRIMRDFGEQKDNDREGRPQSRSFTARSSNRPKRPRSLDLNTILPPLEDPDRQKLRRNLSSSSSGSPVWYDNDKVNNRALSEVSSLSSSLDDNFPAFIHHSQSASSGEEKKHLSENRETVRSSYASSSFEMSDGIDNDEEQVSSKLVRRSSSLSWELPKSSRPKNGLQSTNSSHSLGSTLSQENKIQDSFKPIDVKPIFVLDSTIVRSKLLQSPPPSVINTNGTSTNHSNHSNGFNTNQTLISSYSDDTTYPNEFNVVGKGMLPYNGFSDSKHDSVHAISPPVPALLHAREENGLPLVQGKNVSQMRHNSIISNDNEDTNQMSLSQSTFNKVMSKKLEIMQEAERRKMDRQHRLEEKRKIWLEQQEINKNNKDEELNGHGPKTPPDKPLVKRTARKTLSSSQNGGLVSSMKSLDGTSRSKEPEDRLLRNPDEALRTAMTNMESDDWSVKCSGIRIINALVARHPNVLVDSLHNVNLALLNEVKNLRSTVSRSAIQCFGELFSAMKKNMEGDLDYICKVLLHKSGESNVFIKEDVEKSLTQMSDNVTPQKAATALILGGANHRNAAVRKTTAQFLVAVCERLGTTKIMSGTKDVTDKILLTASQFVMDGAPMTRYYGRKIFFMLLPHPEFDRTVRQYVPTNTVRNIQDILEGLRTKGIGSIPNETASYKSLKGSLK